MSDIAEMIARAATTKPPVWAQQAVSGKNVENQFFAPVNPRFSESKLNAAGYTMKSKNGGPGTVVITNAGDVANTMGHEGFHQRIGQPGVGLHDVEAGWGPNNRVSPDALGNDYRFALQRNMSAIQPENEENGKYWGMRAGRSAEEQLANLFGYEAGLPKGTPITESPIADKLFAGSLGAPHQPLKDYYFSQTSRPYGGVWEGQSQDPRGTLSKIGDFIANIMVKNGLNIPGRGR